MNHGYARCSTNESKQDIDRQVRELKQAGAESIFLEYEHGDAAVKCQLSSLLEQAQPGDTIITLEVSRLARSTKQLCEIIEIIKAKHLRLVIVGSITVDCSNGEIDPMTKDTHHLTTQRHYLNFVGFRMPKYNSAIGKINISILDITNGSGTAATIQKEINDHPISVFTKITICFWLLQKSQ